MTLSWPSPGRRLPRRPLRAFAIAFAALLVLAFPATGLAQAPDPLAGLDAAVSGGAAVPVDAEAVVQEAIEDAGAVAVPETPDVEALVAPEVDVPAAAAPVPATDPAAEPEPDPAALPETAEEPAPEQPPDVEPVSGEPEASVPAPINLNVDIRIFSPGDNGDVTQIVETVGGGGAPAAGGAAPDLEWTWNWSWTQGEGCAPGGTTAAAAITWTWNWDWQCPAMGGGLPEEVFDAPGELFAEVPADLAAGMLPMEAEPPPSSSRPPPAPRPEPARADRLGGGAAGPLAPAADMAPFSIVAGDSDGLAPDVSQAARPTHGRRHADTGRTRAPEQAPPALPSAAASAGGGGMSGGALAAALLALACLLAPAALERARAPYRRLRSLLSSSRLERPG